MARLISSVVLVGLLLPGAVLYQCRITGAIHDSCCCSETGQETQVQMAQPQCCDILSTEAVPVTATRKDYKRHGALPLIGTLATVANVLPIHLSMDTSVGTHVQGPPIYNKVCSYLI